jgi:putative acetyltransferase
LPAVNAKAVSIDDPRAPDVRALLEHHVTWAHGQTVPEDAHALDADGLVDPSITFFSLRRDGGLLAVGALKRIDDDHAEVKSMHTVESARGQGIGRAMVDHLLRVARERGFRRVSLETGAMDAFAAARSLYASAGFEPCEPFGDYNPSRNSIYMTHSLQPMPPSNTDVVRANSEAFSRRDVDAMLELFEADAVAVDRRPIGWGEFRGRDAIRSYYAGLFDNAAEIDEQMEIVSEEGDVVIASCHLTAKLAGQPGDAPEVILDYALRVTLADGLITSIEIFADAEQALS